MSDEVTVFAPASVGNVAVGFDSLGLALEAPGDRVTARRVDEPGVRLERVTGDQGRLPRATGENSASVAARAVVARLGGSAGLVLTLDKGLPLASGLGSSGASAVAGAVAADRVLGTCLAPEALLACAMEGERAACGSAHADNVAPSLLGGLVLVRGQLGPGPPEAIRLPVPAGLTVAVARPHLEILTGESRSILPRTVPLDRAVAWSADLAALVVALFRSDLALVGRSIVDRVAEPVRLPRIRGGAAAVNAAREAGALAASLSGSGPSLFALCADRDTARRVVRAMTSALHRNGVESDHYLSTADAPGARVVEPRSGTDSTRGG